MSRVLPYRPAASLFCSASVFSSTVDVRCFSFCINVEEASRDIGACLTEMSKKNNSSNNLGLFFVVMLQSDQRSVVT